jgi:DegV family protein with EDD domain
MIRIIADSTCDLSPDELEALDIETVPLTIMISGKVYRDCIDITHDELYQRMRLAEEPITTSQVNPMEFEAAFAPHVQQGDEVVALTIGSGFSATYSSALAAAAMTDKTRVHVVDTGTGSFGAALLLREAARLRDAGAHTAGQIADAIRAIAPRVRLYGVVDTLKRLRLSGRLSGGAAMIGNLLGIKPLLRVQNGKLEPAGIARGDNGARKALLRYFLDEKADLSHGIAFAAADAKERLAACVEAFRPYIDKARIFTGSIGAAIGAHTGPGVIGVAWLVNKG